MDKPSSIAADPWRSAKWDELVEENSFDDADAADLAMLIEWYRLADLAMGELAELGDQTAYQTEQGALKPLPQISTLSTCSIRIAQLEDRLGIREERPECEKKGATMLSIVQMRRGQKESEAV